MLQGIFTLFVVLSIYAHYAHLYSSAASHFEFTEEARAALCPFVGTEGMRCFDGEPVKRYGRQFDTGALKLPRGVGISLDRSTGRLKALAVQLTYPTEDTRNWMDGFTGEMFDIFNEATLGSATRVTAAYDASRINFFKNASQFNAVWQRTFAEGKIRGGELAHPPDLLEYMNQFSNHRDALVLSQSVTGLYTLTINASAVQLNSFARRALSKLTATFDPDLYEDFVDSWGTHIITKSLIGGMIEEQAKVVRCFHGGEDSMLVRCIPFWDRKLVNSTCAYYNDRNRVISKRRLGGNVEVDNNHEWKRTLSVAPALLQILEMVPWYEFVTNEAVKQNLRTITRYRQRNVDIAQAEGVRLVDARLSPCVAAILNIPANAQWSQYGTTVAGGKGEGCATNQLYWPQSLFVDDDQTIVIADYNNHRIIQWKKGDMNGQVVAGGNGNGSRLDQLNGPNNVLFDKDTDSLIICDSGNRRIVRWSRRSATTQGEILIDNIAPAGLAMDDQRNLYVSDKGKHEVRRYQIGDNKGTLIAGGNGQGSSLNQLNVPAYIFVDRHQTVYVSDYDNHRVMKWPKGATEGILVAGGLGNGSALTQLYHPQGLVVDSLDTLYVADTANHRVLRWPQGATQGTVIVGGNGAGVAANQLNYPEDVSFDRQGNLYVVEYGNHRAQRFSIQ